MDTFTENLDLEKLKNRKGVKWSKYEDHILPAWIADMDFTIADPISSSIQDFITNSDFGYPSQKDIDLSVSFFCQRAAERYHWLIRHSDVAVINDVVQGIYHSVLSFSHPDDRILVQTPIYPPFLHAPKNLGRKLITNSLVLYGKQFEVDFDQLRSSFNNGVKMLLLCNPHNPTGKVFSVEELGRIGKLCCDYDIQIVSDEIHADLILDNLKHTPISSLCSNFAKRTITLMSASKAFNIAGLCLAFVHFGSDELRKKFQRFPNHLLGGMNAISVAAVNAALEFGDDWLKKVLAQLVKNRDFLSSHARRNWLNTIYSPGQATYLAWVNVSNLKISGDISKYILHRSAVAVSPGADFGNDGKDYFRLNFATSPDILKEIVRRLDQSLSN